MRRAERMLKENTPCPDLGSLLADQKRHLNLGSLDENGMFSPLPGTPSRHTRGLRGRAGLFSIPFVRF